ncbi:ferrochelatase [Paenibacillaceae bacterium]|nr:ferrochelatase [Paenibacillaceae bacterium]
MSDKRIGVLVMSYGTPASMTEIESYYTHIRRGNKPTPEQLADLTGRYEAIVGGVFPLRENTDNQVRGLQETLDRLAPGKYICRQGLKHASPYIEDGIRELSELGVERAVGIVLAPHYSIMSVGSYIDRAEKAAALHNLPLRCVKEYHLHPKLLRALTDRIRRGLDKFGSDTEVADIRVLFSAHSLPERIVEMNDPYPQQLLATSAAVADAAGVSEWQFTWQSAGRTREPWLGPDILDTINMLAKEGVKNILAAPIGFVSDHLEVMYDLDIEAKNAAGLLGIQLERMEMLNTDPLYMETLAESVLGIDQKGE